MLLRLGFASGLPCGYRFNFYGHIRPRIEKVPFNIRDRLPETDIVDERLNGGDEQLWYYSVGLEQIFYEG